MQFVDAHVHLSDPEYNCHIETIIEDARKSNVVAMISNSVNYQTSLQNLRLAQKYPRMVYPALGIHPWNVKELLPNELEDTTEVISDQRKHGKIIAIGEIGLDTKYVKGKLEELMSLQYKVFCKMLKTSEELSLPTIIHSRGSTPEILNILPSYRIKKVLLHWFSSPIDLIPEIIDRGYYITEGPPTVFSSNIQEIIRQIPLANLLTETDGPVRYFKPPFNSETTIPSFIPRVVETIATLKGQETTVVAAQIFDNFKNFFDIELG